MQLIAAKTTADSTKSTRAALHTPQVMENPTANLSEYEIQRLAHIRRNHEYLCSLGLADPAQDPIEALQGKKKRGAASHASTRVEG